MGALLCTMTNRRLTYAGLAPERVFVTGSFESDKRDTRVQAGTQHPPSLKQERESGSRLLKSRKTSNIGLSFRLVITGVRSFLARLLRRPS